MSRKRIELLAPAGGTEQLIAAVENGADAVYLGGQLFNARMNAGNFGEQEMRDAVAYAHQRGVQIHVTMNTLLTSEELPAALEYAAFLYETGVDALIIQDLGLAKLIHEFMPDLPLHLSTQGTVYDIAGVETARRLGFVRVVLARELTLGEIREICAETDTEIEVFVHGALCVCYSGQCQLSRYIGGRSGNRGLCAQPCRLPYKTLDAQGKPVDTIAYPLSPRDQCQIDHLPELIDAGVSSLKIEGRMKSADYVGVVVSIYRKYIDQYYEKGRIRVEDKDREALAQIFNRGSFTDGYFRGRDGMELMTESIPKHQGILCGEVIRRVKGTDLVDVRLQGKLALGDGVEIHGDKLCGNIVTYYQKTKDGVRIGDIRGSLRPGDLVYRTSAKSQLSQVRQSYAGRDLQTADKNGRKTEVSVRVIDEGTKIRLVFTHDSGTSVSVSSGTLEYSDNAADPVRMEQSLRKSGNTPFRIGSVEFLGDFPYILKVSEMNGLRREGLQRLSEALSCGRQKPYCDYMPMVAEKRAQAVECYYYSWDSFRKQPAPMEGELPVISVIPLMDYMEHLSELDPEKVLPYIPPITRGREGDWIEEHMADIAASCCQGVYVGNLGWISRLREAGVPVLGDYGLNVYNEQSEAALDMMGVRCCVYSLEGEDPENGSWPLMVLQHEPEGSALENPHGDRFRLVRRACSDQTLLVAAGTKSDVSGLPIKYPESPVIRVYIG